MILVYFFGYVSSGKGNKSKKIDKSNKRFCIVKDIIKNMKRLLTDWEKVFANNISNKRFVSKIHKELTKLNIKKPKQPCHKKE